MTFEEHFVMLLAANISFNGDANEDDLIAADDLLGKLLDDDNLPSSRPEDFWAFLTELISPDNAHVDLITDRNAKNVARIIDVGKKINPEKWAEPYDPGHELSFHSFPEAHNIQKSKGMDGKNTDFYHYNSDVGFANSMAFVDFRVDPTIVLGSRFNVGDEHIQVIACLLMMENLTELSEGSVLISSIEDVNQAQAQLQYHLVLYGRSWSTPVELPSETKVRIPQLRACLGSPEHYVQFREPFSMLSSVNASTGILEVFMSTYHALENFMIRSQVASTFTENASLSLNRVRDFKRLGARIDQSESRFLKDLFVGCWGHQVGDQSLIEMALECRQAFRDEHHDGSEELDRFFKLLDIRKARDKPKLEYEAFINGDDDHFRGWFSFLIYGIRCSVVHNKATEFHISNENLAENPDWQALLAKLCMPIMIQLAFGLPSVVAPENPIRYSTPTISLYE
ncbi:hypothetical protein CLV80_113112 [Yoonia maritima]|uniref:Uncharacterized protein n=1 Tax=Yoonia maritima TaxID=1435347 RepID=A0A2T0VV09_9RHOB|nr:hypothetical protein [Yoonia maritima]PRY75302.1 hypothetical protein CLV80_113112 [Yoonia maritima]